MSPATLRRFERLYRNARYMGADRTLRRHLGVDEDFVVPLGLTHGVDFGQIDPVQELIAIEPLHWAHNRDIAVRAAPYKPVVEIPHPFLLALSAQPQGPGEGTLVIGPPPGPTNDQRLYELLKDRKERLTILVKPRGRHEASFQFWRERGLEVVTMADFGPSCYETTVRALGAFGPVIGCTFSSLVVFAAAMGRPVELLTGYHYRCFDLVEIGGNFEGVNWAAPRARAIVATFAANPRDEVTALAREILGAELSFDPTFLKESLEAAIARLDSPVFTPRQGPAWLEALRREAAVRLDRPALVRFTLSQLLAARRAGIRVWERDLNEVDLWLSGRNERNLIEHQRAYEKGRTEPGESVDCY